MTGNFKGTIAAALLLAATPAGAQSSWGLRGGLTIDPDQVHVGAHVNAGEIFNDGYFLPNVEVGFGDHGTLIALNPELVYRFDQRARSRWGFYIGGGLGINIYDWDDGPRGYRDDTDTELGLNILGGMSRARRGGGDVFLELKLGVADSPEAKVTLGLGFQ
ncbi:MAG: hypothetical protein Q7W56_01180 [Candidatus Latescibacteria bacterium]|nr:hypothetical protein [Candidatus Latescibacterota bacterium]